MITESEELSFYAFMRAAQEDKLILAEAEMLDSGERVLLLCATFDNGDGRHKTYALGRMEEGLFHKAKLLMNHTIHTDPEFNN